MDIVYGDVSINSASTPVTYTYSRYKITYSGKASTLLNKTTGKPIDAYAVYKSKKLWNASSSSWEVPSSNDKFYNDIKVVDYVVDLEFVPIDEKGLKISPPPTATNANKDKIYKIIFHQENENLVSEKIVLFEILIQEISDVNKLIVLRKELFFLKAMINLNINWRTRTICLFKNIIWLIKTKRLKTGLNYIINGFLKSN
jgi:hypothetical protein